MTSEERITKLEAELASVRATLEYARQQAHAQSVHLLEQVQSLKTENEALRARVRP